MSRALALPAWADNDEGRVLVAQIVAERPDHFIRRGQWVEGGGVKVYESRTAGRLRRMYLDWFDREQAALDAQYHVKGVWDQDASNAVHSVEDGNSLIERILRETEGDIPVENIGGGRFRVAA